MTFSTHWLQPLYTSFPSLPPCMLEFFESILSLYDPTLLHITRQTCIISKLYESLLSMFTDVLSKETWLQVFDFIFCFSEYPELFYLLIPSMIILLKTDMINFAKKEGLQSTPLSDDPSILDNIKQSEKLLEDEQLSSLTRQIQFASSHKFKKINHQFEFSLSQFSESFLSKLRLLSSTQIIKQLHIILRKCYKNSLINFSFSQSQTPSTDLHYPIFDYTSQLII